MGTDECPRQQRSPGKLSHLEDGLTRAIHQLTESEGLVLLRALADCKDGVVRDRNIATWKQERKSFPLLSGFRTTSGLDRAERYLSESGPISACSAAPLRARNQSSHDGSVRMYGISARLRKNMRHRAPSNKPSRRLELIVQGAYRPSSGTARW